MTEPADASDVEAIERPLLDYLDALSIAYTLHRHPPVFTVEESKALCHDLPGAHVKNMFFKDKKGGLWLATVHEDRRFRIKDLERALAAPKLSFGKPDVMAAAIGVAPGAVTPLAVFNDREAHAVTVALDMTLETAEIINCHPLHNAATIALSPADLARFFEATGHAPRRLDVDALERLAAGG